MSKIVYEKGTIKVVWIDKDPHTIYSKMFDSEKEAKKFGSTKKDYVIFALVTQRDMEEFHWKLLPYGRYKTYLSLTGFYQKSKSTPINQFLHSVLP